MGGFIFAVLLANIMADFMKAFELCAHPEPPVHFIVLANLTTALLYSFIFNRMGINTFQTGLMTGAWISFLLIVWFDFWMLATFKAMNFNMMVFDVIGNTAVGALAGGVIGWILGKVK